MLEQYDSEQGYCRKLGHHLNFQYCRTERNGKPCIKIFDCWFEKFDIKTFMRENFTSEEIEALNSATPPKTNTLLNLIQQAKNRQKRGN